MGKDVIILILQAEEVINRDKHQAHPGPDDASDKAEPWGLASGLVL